MTFRSLRNASAALAFVAGLGAASTAEAATNPCGNIELKSILDCEFVVEGCDISCEPLNFTASCDGECNASIDANCTTSCTGTCEADCEVSPGSFDCTASCRADCSASAKAMCEGMGNQADCEAYADADCSGQCDTECSVTSPEADCMAQCNACCTGSCDVQANFDCSFMCSAELEGGCEGDCSSPEGALFCDGQFIAVSNLDECIAYLATNLNFSFEVEASANVSASGCAFDHPQKGQGGLIFVLLTGLGVVAVRRRKSR